MKSMKLGGGGRFAKLAKKLQGKVENPKAVAAKIGMDKYGKKKMMAMAHKARMK